MSGRGVRVLEIGPVSVVWRVGQSIEAHGVGRMVRLRVMAAGGGTVTVAVDFQE